MYGTDTQHVKPLVPDDNTLFVKLVISVAQIQRHNHNAEPLRVYKRTDAIALDFDQFVIADPQVQRHNHNAEPFGLYELVVAVAQIQRHNDYTEPLRVYKHSDSIALRIHQLEPKYPEPQRTEHIKTIVRQHCKLDHRQPCTPEHIPCHCIQLNLPQLLQNSDQFIRGQKDSSSTGRSSEAVRPARS